MIKTILYVLFGLGNLSPTVPNPRKPEFHGYMKRETILSCWPWVEGDNAVVEGKLYTCHEYTYYSDSGVPLF